MVRWVRVVWGVALLATAAAACGRSSGTTSPQLGQRSTKATSGGVPSSGPVSDVLPEQTTVTVTATSTTTVMSSPSTSTSSSAPFTSATAKSVALGGSVRGKVIVLDPGHNGENAAHVGEISRLVNIGNGMKACNTTGTETNAGYSEAAFNWDLAVSVDAILRQAGATVVLTRQNNAGWGPCIDQRAAIANQAHAAAAVSIHGDGASASDRGFHVIYPIPLAGLNATIAGPSKLLAGDLRDAFAHDTSMPISNYAGTDGLAPRSDIGGLNLAKVPAVLIEGGNMRNSTDAALLSNPAWRQQAAVAIAQGIAAFVSP